MITQVTYVSGLHVVISRSKDTVELITYLPQNEFRTQICGRNVQAA